VFGGGGGGGGGGVVSGFGFGLRSLCGGVGKVLLLLLSVLGPYFVSCWRVTSLSALLCDKY
jgi:hypothetical protein